MNFPFIEQPIYDSWLSIGNTENKQINIEGKQIPIKIISYYDKLTDFGFDNKNMQMKFDMPFNWNQSRLNKSSIFVHEEISTKTKCLYYEGLLHWKGKWMDISKNTVIQLAEPGEQKWTGFYRINEI